TRARALRAVLGEYPQTLLIEDDHGHRIVDLPLCPLAGVTRHWAFLRSVAKAYGPDLRLAVLTGDAVTMDRVQGRQRLGPGWVSRLLQRAVAGLWSGDAVDTRAVAQTYGRRRDALIDALAERGIEAYGRSGMNVWVPVPDETGAVARLLHSGWAVAPGARFRTNAPPGLRITVSTLDPAEAGVLADAIATAVWPAPARRYV
ncbi:aminotransferase class I/II-fold pyridoxal phosphate-dependent enzyme, partial [Streptomyces aurantiacus]